MTKGTLKCLFNHHDWEYGIVILPSRFNLTRTFQPGHEKEATVEGPFWEAKRCKMCDELNIEQDLSPETVDALVFFKSVRGF